MQGSAPSGHRPAATGEEEAKVTGAARGTGPGDRRGAAVSRCSGCGRWGCVPRLSPRGSTRPVSTRIAAGSWADQMDATDELKGATPPTGAAVCGAAQQCIQELTEQAAVGAWMATAAGQQLQRVRLLTS